MPLPELTRYIVAVIATGLFIWAGYTDIRERKIPNTAVLALLALFVPWTLASGGDGLVSALEALGVAFLVTVALYLFKVIGAGDSKLFAAAALLVGLQQLPAFALATVLCGGVIALVIMAARPTRALVMLQMRGRGDFGRGIPYGVAIGFGGVLVIWGTLLGFLPHVFGGGRALGG